MLTQPLSRLTLLAYGLPALPLAAMYFPVFVFLSEFYAAERGLSLAAIGTVLLLVRLFDAVTDPVIGFLSDRTRSRFGRRKLWLLAATPVIAGAAWALFVPPQGATIWWFAGFMTLLTAAWTLALIPYFAWGAEMSGNYAERSRITIWRESLGLAGTILAALLYASDPDTGTGLARVALFIVIALPLATAICLLRVPEPVDLSRTAPRISAVLGILATERSFRRLLIAYFINGAANGIAATLFIFFVSYRLERPDLAGPLLVLYFAAAICAAPLWSWTRTRYSKHRTWCVAMIYAGIVFAWTATLGPGDWVGFAVICVLSGAALGADLALPSSLQADLVDVATAQSGAQQTGAFFALWSLATKLALAVAGGAALIYLDWAGFSVTSGQGTGALTLLYAAGPIALKSIAIAMMWSFPHDPASHSELRARIERGFVA